MKYLKLMRIRHWIKNLLVLLPLVCSGRIIEKNLLRTSCLGMVSFCFLSSVIYIINDIMDRNKDRLHPKKKNRPIASGAISVSSAIKFAVILFSISLIINFICAKSTIIVWGIYVAYFIVNLLYSVAGMKKIPLIDVALLVAGFFIRVYYGAAIIYIPISGWLYLVIITGAFYLGFGKRRNELQKLGTNTTRDVLSGYSIDFLDKALTCSMTLSITFFSLWCMEKNAQIMQNKNNYLLAVPVLMLIFFKYGLDLEGNSDGDPVDVILQDKLLMALGIVFVGMLLWFIYI